MANKKLTSVKRPKTRRSFYRIRRINNARGYVNYVIAVPREIGEILEPLGYVYDFEMTEDGLLLRPLLLRPRNNPTPPSVDLPEWVTK